jgi:hypothetical protein
MAERDKVVITQTRAEMPMIINDSKIPDCPTTQERRRNSITPQMFKRHGISTPWIHPSFTPCPPSATASGFFSSSFIFHKPNQFITFFKLTSSKIIGSDIN